MMCLPFLGPDGSRDDRYVRARPLGDCSDDGDVMCVSEGDGEMGFAVCDHGGWIDMGDVAPGTTCTAGEIVQA